MQPETLLDALEMNNVDKLKAIYDVLVARRGSRPTRKGEIVDAIANIFLDNVQGVWGSLSKHEKLVVQEAVHDPLGYLDVGKFVAKHGKAPFRKNTEPWYSSRRTVTRLELFLHMGERYERQAWVPGDLQRLLQGFVPAPKPAELPFATEIPSTVKLESYGYDYASGKVVKVVTNPAAPIERCNMEAVARANLLAVLTLIDEGRISVSASTQRPSAATMRRIAEVLDGGDFYMSTKWEAETGPIQAFAWPILVQAGRLARQDGSRLELTPAGRKALSTPPHETLKQIWKRWLSSRIMDEFSRIESIKGQTRGRGKAAMTATEPRRQAIQDALVQCPLRGAVAVDDLAKFMVATGLGFEVTRSPWTLYVNNPQYGALEYEFSLIWSVLQDRYLLCVLFEYAATLGMIDVAFVPPGGARPKPWESTGYFEGSFLSRYDGLKYFRLTALGAYCLGLTDEYKPDTPETSTPLSVFPDLRIVVRHGRLDHEERALLRCFADEEEPDTVWRISTERILKSFETGLNIGAVREFLSARDEQPLPERVEGFLASIESNARAIRPAGTGVLFECDSEETARKLLADRKIAKFSSSAGKNRIIVDTASEQSFRKAARQMGFGFDNG